MSNYRVCYLRPDRKVSIFYHPNASSDADVLRQAHLCCPRNMTMEIWKDRRGFEVLLSARGDSQAA